MSIAYERIIVKSFSILFFDPSPSVVTLKELESNDSHTGVKSAGELYSDMKTVCPFDAISRHHSQKSAWSKMGAPLYEVVFS